MILKQLLQQVNIETELPDTILNHNIASITHNSDQVSQDSLFIAIKGFNTDGHLYLEAAKKNGAIVALTEYQTKCKLPQIIVPNTRKSLADLGRIFHGEPSEKLQMIGVTGTNGKTTTCYLVHYLLDDFKKTGLIGSVEILYDNYTRSSSITTPDALELHQYLQAMVKANINTCVMEVSSHGLELDRVSGIKYQITGITNISPDHFDLHHNLQNYFLAKQKLFQNDDRTNFAFYNIDDTLATKAASISKATKISFGQSDQADLQIVKTNQPEFSIVLSERAQKILKLSETHFKCKTPLIGLHNMYNVTLAVGICLAANCPLTAILTKLPHFNGIKRRLQTIYNDQFRIIDDYAHNSKGIVAALDAVTSLKPKRLIIVCAIRGNRGSEINSEIGYCLGKKLSGLNIPIYLIVTDSNDVVGEHDYVTKKEHIAFLSGLNQIKKNIPIYEEPLLNQALKKAVRLGQEGDIILLLGAQGMDHAQELIHQSLLVEV